MEESNLQAITLSPEHYDLWDKFVDDSPQGDVFCYSWWLKAITKSNFKILAILNCNEIQAGIPLAFDENGKINEPPLTRTLGPLYKNIGDISEYSQLMLNRKWLNILLKQITLDEVVQFCTHQNFRDWLPFRWKGFKQMTRYTYLVYYQNQTEEDLWNRLIKNRKWEIIKARKNGLYVEITDDIELFYHLVEMSYERQGLKFGFKFDDFKRLDDEIHKRDKRRIFLALDKNNRPLAAIYIAFNRKSAYYLLSGSDTETRHLGGHTLAWWESLKYFRTRTDYSNFGGSDIRRIEKYLRGFGGTLTHYFHIFTEQPIIKEVPLIKEVPVQLPLLRDDWKYHVRQILHHHYCLLNKAGHKFFGSAK